MKVCLIEGCERTHRARGYCFKHYTRLKDYGRLELIRPSPDGRRSHKFYSLWFERKKQICPEWQDFWTFVNDISPKPEGNYLLVRKDGSKPYSADNFMWQEHLKRKEDETKKEWWARKWSSRQANNPGLERHRTLKRRFGITHEQHLEMIEQQQGKCAICGLGETAYCSISGSRRRLAIDHSHETNKVRGLLCNRCNTTLGRVGENIEILENMKQYLIIHSL